MTIKRACSALIAYISHPFASNPEANASAIRKLCRGIAQSGVLPLPPQLYLPQFLNEKTHRELAMSYCLRLVGVCDELWLFGEPTEGMRLEIAEAERLGIPVINCTKEGKPR